MFRSGSNKYFKIRTFAIIFIMICCNVHGKEPSDSEIVVLQMDFESSPYSSRGQLSEEIPPKAVQAIHFKAFNEKFELLLQTFNQSFIAQDSKISIYNAHDTEHDRLQTMYDEPLMYQGLVHGDDHSFVTGFVYNETFTGIILLGNGSIIGIEPFKEFERNITAIETRSVVYKGANENFTYCIESGICESHAVFRYNPIQCKRVDSNIICSDSSFQETFKIKENILGEKLNLISKKSDELVGSKFRDSFSSKEMEVSSSKTNSHDENPLQDKNCGVELYVGPSLGTADPKKFIAEMTVIALFTNHILRMSDFDFDGKQDNLGIILEHIGFINSEENPKLPEKFRQSRNSDRKTVAGYLEKYRELPQESCMSFVFVNDVLDGESISAAMGGGVCRGSTKKENKAQNIGVISTMDFDGRKKSLFEISWMTTIVAGQILGSQKYLCKERNKTTLTGNWRKFYSDCQKESISMLLKERGNCLKTCEKREESSIIFKEGDTEFSGDGTNSSVNETEEDTEEDTEAEDLPTESNPQENSEETETNNQTETTESTTLMITEATEPITLGEIETTEPTTPLRTESTKDELPSSSETDVNIQLTTKNAIAAGAILEETIAMGNEDEKMQSHKSSICGNGRVEGGEECDCGDESTCKMMRSCCVPSGKKNQCQIDRGKGYQCDHPDPCCNEDCKFVPESWQLDCTKLMENDDCVNKPLFCDGMSSKCPFSQGDVARFNGKRCKVGLLDPSGSGTCLNGHCKSTVCMDAGLDDCFCPPTSARDACLVCCRKIVDNTNSCLPANELGVWADGGQPHNRQPGTPCKLTDAGRCNDDGSCIYVSLSSNGLSHLVEQSFIRKTIILAFIYICAVVWRRYN